MEKEQASPDSELCSAILTNTFSFILAAQWADQMVTFLNSNSVDAVSLYTGCKDDAPSIVTLKGREKFISILTDLHKNIELKGFKAFLSADFKAKKAAVGSSKSKIMILLKKIPWEEYSSNMIDFYNKIDLSPSADFCKQFKAMLNVFGIKAKTSGFDYDRDAYGDVLTNKSYNIACQWDSGHSQV